MSFEIWLTVNYFKLKIEKNKVFTEGFDDPYVAYIFKDKNEFKKYFIDNGCINIDEELMRLAKFKTARNGNIIALNGLCDKAIVTHKNVEETKKRIRTIGRG